MSRDMVAFDTFGGGRRKVHSRRSRFIPMFEIDINHRQLLLLCRLHLMYFTGFDQHSHLHHCPITGQGQYPPFDLFSSSRV